VVVVVVLWVLVMDDVLVVVVELSVARDATMAHWTMARAESNTRNTPVAVNPCARRRGSAAPALPLPVRASPKRKVRVVQGTCRRGHNPTLAVAHCVHDSVSEPHDHTCGRPSVSAKTCIDDDEADAAMMAPLTTRAGLMYSLWGGVN